jgi:WhiB family redox-sensing transcriptional regulator
MAAVAYRHRARSLGEAVPVIRFTPPLVRLRAFRLAPPPAELAWMERGGCCDLAESADKLFFAASREGQRRALAICRTCPVMRECRAYAVRTGQRHGVWGGLRQQELRQLVDRSSGGSSRETPTAARHHNARKTHCKYGHRFDAENTYHAANGRRHCRTCRRAARQRHQRNRRFPLHERGRS